MSQPHCIRCHSLMFYESAYAFYPGSWRCPLCGDYHQEGPDILNREMPKKKKYLHGNHCYGASKSISDHELLNVSIPDVCANHGYSESWVSRLRQKARERQGQP